MSLERVRTSTHGEPWGEIGCGPAVLPAYAGGPRVLVAEDDDDLRALICDELRRVGLEVIGCSSAREAVRQREWSHSMAGEPGSLDAVVTDLCLGEIDGLALLRRVGEAGVDVPVVLISAFGDAGSRARAGELGAAAFLDKPVAMAALAGLVSRLALARQRRVRERAGDPRPGRWRRVEM